MVRGCPGLQIDERSHQWLQIHSLLWSGATLTLQERLHLPLQMIEAMHGIDQTLKESRDDRRQ